MLHISQSNDQTRGISFQSICQETHFQYTEPKFCTTSTWNVSFKLFQWVLWSIINNSKNKWHLNLPFYKLVPTFHSWLRWKVEFFIAVWPINSATWQCELQSLCWRTAVVIGNSPQCNILKGIQFTCVSVIHSFSASFMNICSLQCWSNKQLCPAFPHEGWLTQLLLTAAPLICLVWRYQKGQNTMIPSQSIIHLKNRRKCF